MKKVCLVFLSIFFLSLNVLYAQEKVYLQGVLTKPLSIYQKGDTVQILAKKFNYNTGKPQYLISVYSELKTLNEDRVDILDHDLDFWEMTWFENRAEDVAKSGWEKEKRLELQEDALDYYSQALSNNMVFQDDMLYDYLYQLVNLIHPTSLLKERTSNFSIVVLNSTELTSFAFDNGMIVLTTGLIARTASEQELLEVLSACVAHSVLEHNLINLNRALKAERRARIWSNIAAISAAAVMAADEINNGVVHDYSLAADLGLSVYFLSTRTLENIGASYSQGQNSTAGKIGRDFLKLYPDLANLDDYQYMTIIANAISFTAWQEYHLKNYPYAKLLAEKLNDKSLATDKDYLLLSRIQRKISNDNFSIQLALDYVNKGRQKSLEPLADLEKEAGIIYSRLGQPELAKDSYIKYREHLLELKREGKNVESELQNINQLIQRRSYLENPVATQIDN